MQGSPDQGEMMQHDQLPIGQANEPSVEEQLRFVVLGFSFVRVVHISRFWETFLGVVG